ENGVSPRADYERRGRDAHQNTGYELALSLFGLEEPPSAIFVTNHLLMLGVMQAARDCGYAVPKTLSLVGFDDTPWAGLLDPPLTTVAQPMRALGSTAANLLIDRVDRGYRGEPRRVILPPKLIVRGSVAPTADMPRKSRSRLGKAMPKIRSS
ncbi:MAG: substrate-binding domain-containing protein, partial [Candidatus Eremiobacteraeota bacterium]|nr:substrate-binding domain-containing protein [Candidatus Eremiobacteraeota bacterium]